MEDPPLAEYQFPRGRRLLVEVTNPRDLRVSRTDDRRSRIALLALLFASRCDRATDRPGLTIERDNELEDRRLAEATLLVEAGRPYFTTGDPPRRCDLTAERDPENRLPDAPIERTARDEGGLLPTDRKLRGDVGARELRDAKLRLTPRRLVDLGRETARDLPDLDGRPL